VGTTADNPQDFIAHNQELMDRGGFNQQDVDRMFRGRELERTIRDAHQNIPYTNVAPDQLKPEQRREQNEAINRAIAQIPEADRLGIGAGSLRSYIRDPRNWGENRAAWERVSIQRMDGDVGNRIINTATHNDGVTMMGAVMRSQVARQERLHPGDQNAVIRGVAATHNARSNYPDEVLSTYNRLYPNGAPPAPQQRPPQPAPQPRPRPQH
jgi:hypothetical protein